MIGVSVSGAEKVTRKFEALGRDVKQESERMIRDAMKLVTRALQHEMTAPANMHPFWGKQGANGNGLSVRSGKTRASLTAGSRVYRNGTKLTAVVGSAEKSLKLHEDGATISGGSPKGFARIPTKAAQTAAGVDRYAGRSARDIPGSFIVRSSTGKLWIARNVGGARSKAVEFLYLLVRTITLKPRRIFARVRDAMAPKVAEATRGMVRAVVNKANS